MQNDYSERIRRQRVHEFFCQKRKSNGDFRTDDEVKHDVYKMLHRTPEEANVLINMIENNPRQRYYFETSNHELVMYTKSEMIERIRSSVGD